MPNIQGYALATNPPQLGNVPFVGDSKLRMGVASVILGSVIIVLIGQPTLLHKLFSGFLGSAEQLNVALWDTSEIIRNNLIAMTVALAGLITWNKFSNYA